MQPDWIASAWANINGPGDANVCHFHPGWFWSGTYYVDDGGVWTNHSLGGDFEMLDPRGSAPAMLAPTMVYAGEGGRVIGSTEWIRPRFCFRLGCSTRCAPIAASGNESR